MKKIDKKYEKIHKLCFGNRNILKKVGKCVCIDCGSKFDYKKLEKVDCWGWYNDINDTAICPFCSVDSVIPLIVDGKTLTDEDIDIMSKYYFWNEEGDINEN